MGEWGEGDRRGQGWMNGGEGIRAGRLQGCVASELQGCRASGLRVSEALGMLESGVRERGGGRAGWIGEWGWRLRTGQRCEMGCGSRAEWMGEWGEGEKKGQGWMDGE